MNECRYLTCAETAKLVRAALKSAFPGVRFSVRSETYAGGASIDIRWSDGPTAAQVDAVAWLYQGSTFDGMQDLKTPHRSLLAGPEGVVEEVHFGADFVFTHRTLSSELLERLEEGFPAPNVRGAPDRCDGCGDWGRFPDGVGYLVRADGSPRVCCSPPCAARLAGRYTDAREAIES